MITSTAGTPSVGWMSTGMPRPSSTTVTEPSLLIVTSMLLAKPASASSIELSTTSNTQWCRPLAAVSPMYMAGRRRTASRPSSTWIEEES